MDTLIAAAPYLVIVLLVAVAIFAFRHGRVTGIASKVQPEVIKAEDMMAAYKPAIAHWVGNAVAAAESRLRTELSAVRAKPPATEAPTAGAIAPGFFARVTDPGVAVVQPKEASTVQPLTGLILFQLMVVIATGQHNADLEGQLGGQYNAYKNQYGPSGAWYQPELVMEAGRASGLPQFWPPRFAWAGYQQRGYGTAQGDKWVWNANLLGPFATYYKP